MYCLSEDVHQLGIIKACYHIFIYPSNHCTSGTTLVSVPDPKPNPNADCFLCWKQYTHRMRSGARLGPWKLMLNAFFFINMYQLASFQSAFLICCQENGKLSGRVLATRLVIYLNKRNLAMLHVTYTEHPSLSKKFNWLYVCGCRVFSM